MSMQADMAAGSPDADAEIAPALVGFTGKRGSLLGKLIKGFLLFLPTLGLYRFWLVTQKRRFYWSHTEIDGDPLEYTGSAVQLLVGFLIAVVIFLPMYGFFFYLSLQGVDWIIWGYGAVAIVLYLLTGYAIYRSRRFRLTRTLWRGIRFHQSGSAWGYAWRRFGWSLLMLPTLGLAFPFMASSLWRYRISHTWFGDRQFNFSGKASTIAWPFYIWYGLTIAVVAVAGFLTIEAAETGDVENNILVGLSWLLPSLVAYMGYLVVKSREVSRFGSAVSCGDANLNVRVRARSIFGQHSVYGLLLGLIFLVIGGVVIGYFISLLDFDEILNFQETFNPADMLRFGMVNLIAMVATYLLLHSLWSMLSELVLAFGFWKLVARGTQIKNADDLKSVRSASSEESPLAGEGLADALNVGGY